jgi:hypothetical protein
LAAHHTHLLLKQVAIEPFIRLKKVDKQDVEEMTVNTSTKFKGTGVLI